MDWQTSVKSNSEAVAHMYNDTAMANILFVVGQDKEVRFIFLFQILIV